MLTHVQSHQRSRSRYIKLSYLLAPKRAHVFELSCAFFPLPPSIMADQDSDVELITSPRKVASIRRMSSLRTKTRRSSLTTVKPPNVRRPRPTFTARVTLLCLPGQKQSLLTFAKKKQILDEARAALAKRKELPPVQPGPSDSSSSEDAKDSDDDDDETVTIPWEDET